MPLIKAIFLFASIALFIIAAIIIRIILFFSRGLFLKSMAFCTKLFSSFLCFMLNVKVEVLGERKYLDEGGNLVISNHLGYLDGIVISSLFKVIFVSKSEVKKWPLFGLMTRAAGTIFIDRKSKSKSPDYVRQAQDLLKGKVNLLVFPEGTSTNGEKLCPFQSIHFQAPLESKASILPLVITYTKINNENPSSGNRDKVCWYGQVKFYKHIFRVLRLRSIEARVIILPKVGPQDISDRKALSRFLCAGISGYYPLFREASKGVATGP